MTTKEKILFEALSQFSVKGYSSVSIRDIAYAVGIKESSIYNHYVNKQAIFDEIILFCQNRASQQYELLNLQETFKGNFDVYEHIPPQVLLTISKTMFNFYVSDEYLRKFRQMLTIEQYNNAHIAVIYKDTFIDQPIQFQTLLFQHLILTGSLHNANPKALALEFYAPIFLLLCRYDSLEDASELLNIHINHFIQKNSKI